MLLTAQRSATAKHVMMQLTGGFVNVILPLSERPFTARSANAVNIQIYCIQPKNERLSIKQTEVW
jgi:hypothetical protein